MDVLSEVLKAIRLDAAFFYNAEFTAPWSFREPRSEVVASHFGPTGRHIIIYHLLTEGRCVASVEGGNPIEIGSGNAVTGEEGADLDFKESPKAVDADDIVAFANPAQGGTEAGIEYCSRRKRLGVFNGGVSLDRYLDIVLGLH